MGWVTEHLSAPDYVADPNSLSLNTGRQIDWSRVPDSYKVGTHYTITFPSGASAAATSIVTSPLPVDLPIGAILDSTGVGEITRLTAPALAGATSVAVEALDAAIEAGDTADYLVSQSNSKFIPGGTVMCQLTSGMVVPRAVHPGSETAKGLLYSSARENSRTAALTGYGMIVGGVIYENLLPETITSYKSELVTNGAGFVWETYADDTEVSA